MATAPIQETELKARQRIYRGVNELNCPSESNGNSFPVYINLCRNLIKLGKLGSEGVTRVGPFSIRLGKNRTQALTKTTTKEEDVKKIRYRRETLLCACYAFDFVLQFVS